MDSAGKTLPPLMVPADAPAEGLGWAFFFFFPSHSLSFSLSFKATPALSFSHHGATKPSLALMGMKHSSRCLLLRRKMAENASESTEVRRPEAGPATRRPPGYPAAARTPARAAPLPVPNFLSSIPFAPAGRLRVSVCAWCVCVLGGGKTVPVSGPLPLEKCKRVALTPASSPSTRCSLAPAAPPAPNPESQALGCRAPLPSPLGSVRAPEWRTVPSLDGRPRGQVVSLQGLDRSSGPSPFKLALLVPAAPRRASGLGDAEPRRGGAGAPPTDPGAQTRAGERSATRDLRAASRVLTRGGSSGRGHLQDRGQRPRLPQPSPRALWGLRAAPQQLGGGGSGSSANCAPTPRLRQPGSCPFSTLELARSCQEPSVPRPTRGWVSCPRSDSADMTPAQPVGSGHL